MEQAQYVRKGSLVQVMAEWMRPSAWIDQSGTPQASIYIDANRLVLLDKFRLLARLSVGYGMDSIQMTNLC